MSGGRHIVVVGNGEVPDSAFSAIEGADIVVRFNDCRSAQAGNVRTDVVAVCNTGRPAKAMLGSSVWGDSEAVRRAGEIWSVRDPRRFAALCPQLAVSHPELDDFCDDYTDGFAAFAAASGKRHRVIGEAVHLAVDAALGRHQPGPYIVPSSGMIVIADLLSSGSPDRISIVGFSHVGWEGHPFAAERRLVDAYVAEGRLRRLDSGIAVQNPMPYISGRG